MIVRNVDDFNKITFDIEELELVEFPFLVLDEKFFSRFFNLKKVTFTKMFITSLDFIPKNISSLAFYDCYIEGLDKLREFNNLSSLTITNYKNLDLRKIVNLSLLRFLDISYCSIEMEEVLLLLDNLEEIDISYLEVKNYNFLRGFTGLKKIIIDRDTYLNNKGLMKELESTGIVIYDMLGGIFNEIQ